MGLASAAQLSTAISLNSAGCESQKSLMHTKSPGLFSAKGPGHRGPSASTVSTAEPGSTTADQTAAPQPTRNIADELLGPPPPTGQSTSPTAASPVETAAPNPAPSVRNASSSLVAAAFMAAVFASAVMLL